MKSEIFIPTLILLLWYNVKHCRASSPEKRITPDSSTSHEERLTEAEIQAADHVYKGTFNGEKTCNWKAFQNAVMDAGGRDMEVINVHPYGRKHKVIVVRDIVDPDMFWKRMHFHAGANKNIPELIGKFEPVLNLRRRGASGAGPSGSNKKTADLNISRTFKNLVQMFGSRKKKGGDDDAGDYHPLPQSPSDES